VEFYNPSLLASIKVLCTMQVVSPAPFNRSICSTRTTSVIITEGDLRFAANVRLKCLN